MKILIVANDMQNGGVERVLSVLANYFAKNGHSVHILAIRTGNISYPVSERINYEFIPMRNVKGNESLGQEIKIFSGLFKYMKKLKPDILIGFDDSIIIRTVPIAWLLGIKTIVSERIDPSIYGKVMRIVRQIAYDMADHVVFQTPDARDYFPVRTRKKSVVIPNPLSEGLPVRSSEINKDIIMACRIRKQKNVGLAIKAFAKFYALHPDHRLVVYGDGELLGEMKKLALENNVGNVVVFPGHVSDIHNKMEHCAIYLSTSDYEGISNSMLEAMAIGAPVICTDCPVGGARMFIRDGENGLLVPVGDEDAIADSMSRLVENSEIANRLSMASREIREILSVDRICPQWMELFE